MDQVQAICRRYNLILIEDCAQALGATFRGRLAGTFGQASIFSFGRDKVVSSVIGGAAVLNQPNPAWQFQLTQLYKQLPSLSQGKVIGSLIFTS
jgi:dTDP-4-amino-4,6-dideoxygalactose transaminase